MPYSAESIPSSHGEFSGGPGLIDPVLRADRVLEPHQQLMEMYATESAPPEVAHGSTEEEFAARAAEIAAANLPETAPIAGVPVEG